MTSKLSSHCTEKTTFQSKTSCPRNDSRSIPESNPTCSYPSIGNRKHFIAMHWEAGKAQWRERSPPNNVAWVRLPDPAWYAGWVCCWFSTLLREVFLRVLRFSPLLKTNISKSQFDPGMLGHFWTSSCELLGGPWKNIWKKNLKTNVI